MRGQIGECFTQVQPEAGVANVAKILLVGVINVQIDADEDDEEYEEDQVQHGAGVANVAKILFVSWSYKCPNRCKDRVVLLLLLKNSLIFFYVEALQ